MAKRILLMLLGNMIAFSLILNSCNTAPDTNPTVPSTLEIPNPGQGPVSEPLQTESAPYQETARSLREYPEVILGKDNWLFWGGPINEAVHYGVLDDTQIERIIDELSYINNILKERGIDFLFVITPDKRLIYPEYMPDIYKESDVPSSYDRLTEALSKSDIDFIDFKPFLQNKKSEIEYRMYYLRDRRWNSLGNLLAVQELLTHIGEKYPVPGIELLSIDTSNTRVTTGELGNDLNNLMQLLAPWQENGAPEPVYNIYRESQAPPVLWYGTCFSPLMINLMQEGWPDSITYVPLWEGYGFPVSLRYDLSRRIIDHKIVIFEMNEHYSDKLSRMLIPAPPEVGDHIRYRYHYDWQPSNILRDWKQANQYDINVENEVLLITADNPDLAPSLYTNAPLTLDPSREYHLVIQVNSPSFTGITITISVITAEGIFLEHHMGQHIYEGDNTVIFDIPEQDKLGYVKSIIIHLGDKVGVYGVSQIAIYSRLKP